MAQYSNVRGVTDSEDDFESDDDDSATDEEQILNEKPDKVAPCRLLVLLCGCASIEGADMFLLGSTALALQRDLGLSMKDLAMMTLVQALSMSATAPLWGVLADRGVLRRKTLLILGAVLQGFLTIILATVSDLRSMLVLRALNGCMLASIRPIANGIVADTASERQRGKAFGWIGLSMSLGMCACSLVTVPMATRSIWGIRGWRLAYAMLGCGAISIGLLLAILMKEPPREVVLGARLGKRRALVDELKKFISYFTKPTFCVLVVQGMFGCVPWQALSYQTLFFQISGLTNFQAGSLPALQQIASAVGNLLGGCIGDCMSARCPFHGRAFAAQISVAAGIPIVASIFLHVPSEGSAYEYYALLLILLGLTGTWTPASTNLPMLSSIVEPSGRATIMAWQGALEGSWGAIFGNAAVGILAQDVFGYDVSKIQNSTQAAAEPENMRVLGLVLTYVSVVPWLICFAAYSFLHWSYRQDLKQIYKDTQSEMAEMSVLVQEGEED